MTRSKTDALMTEEEFLARYDPNAFEHPSLAVDVVLLTVFDDSLAVALVRRTEHPHRLGARQPGAQHHGPGYADQYHFRFLRGRGLHADTGRQPESSSRVGDSGRGRVGCRA